MKGGRGSEAKFLTSFSIFRANLKGRAFFKESVSTTLKVVVALGQNCIKIYQRQDKFCRYLFANPDNIHIHIYGILELIDSLLYFNLSQIIEQGLL